MNSAAQTARAILASVRDAVFSRAALARSARSAIRSRSEQLAAGRRVLYLERGQSLQAIAEAEPFDLAVSLHPSDLSEPILDAIVHRLPLGGQMVLVVVPGTSQRCSSQQWRELLQQRFLHVDGDCLAGATTGELRFEDNGEASDVIFEILTASAPQRLLPEGPLRLHVGSGSQRLDGWVNVDIRPFPGVDLVADVTRGLDYQGVDAVYAEHFLEHLAADEAIDFLIAVHRMLTAEGRLRLSTPNLDWVWTTHYRLEATADQKREAALAINRAFHGWGHQFVWNRETLERTLRVVGFRDLSWHRHGESDVEMFRGMEAHETYDDTEDLSHVLIVEARPGTPDTEGLEALRGQFQRDLLDHVAGY